MALILFLLLSFEFCIIQLILFREMAVGMHVVICFIATLMMLTLAQDRSKLRCELEVHEGVRYESYLDSLGKLTAGIGHLLVGQEARKYPVGTKVSPAQVELWYSNDSNKACSLANSFLGSSVFSKLHDVRKRAMCNLAFNLGSKLNQFVKFREAMIKGDYTAAARELKNSRWYSQVGLRGPEVATQIEIARDTGRIAKCE